MKGMLLACVAICLYGLLLVVAAWITRPKRHLWLFTGLVPLGALAYTVLYALTPADLFFLPALWVGSPRWVDFCFGLAVFGLSCQTVVHVVFVACSGFSVSLLMAIHQASGATATTSELVALFEREDGTDRIYSWRLPHLQKRGYLHRDSATGHFSLTAKGRLVAQIAAYLKRLMNLGEGG